MNAKRTAGLVSLVAGVVIVFLSVAADYIGIGAFPGFGYKQIVGTILGLIMIFAGLAFFPKRNKVIR